MDRNERVKIARSKAVPPYTLDDTLTFFCPQENVEGLQHPAVRAIHEYVTREYEPPLRGKKAVLLMLPCTRVKPYILSPEHQAINGYLLAQGFEPVEEADYPPEIEAALPAGSDRRLLNNRVWARGDLYLHRCVVSEPMALVPYDLLYWFKGQLSPVARYDDPGLFEHRGNAVCPWRSDYTGRQGPKGYRWGDHEKAAYVQMHNRMVELVVEALDRFGDAYVACLAYVSPKLTHRSFVTSVEEKRRAGLPVSKRTSQGVLPLVGINDLRPGLVHSLPDEEDIERILARLGERYPERSPRQIRGYFATGGGKVTPLSLPETLEVLGQHLNQFQH